MTDVLVPLIVYLAFSWWKERQARIRHETDNKVLDARITKVEQELRSLPKKEMTGYGKAHSGPSAVQ